MNNAQFYYFLNRIYTNEPEINNTTDTQKFASYLDLYLEIVQEDRLRSKLYDKRDDFNFLIVNIPLICSNNPAVPAYTECIILDFLDEWWLLTSKLIAQGFMTLLFGTYTVAITNCFLIRSVCLANDKSFVCTALIFFRPCPRLRQLLDLGYYHWKQNGCHS